MNISDADKRKAAEIAAGLAEWRRPAIVEAIATALAEEREAERERCAQIAEQDSVLNWVGGSTGSAKGTAIWIAAAIRTP